MRTFLQEDVDEDNEELQTDYNNKVVLRLV